MSRANLAAIWGAIIGIILLTFIFSRFTSNHIHARQLEDGGELDRAQSMYDDILNTRATSLDDSLEIIRKSQLLSSNYYPVFVERFDNSLDRLESGDQSDSALLSSLDAMLSFISHYQHEIDHGTTPNLHYARLNRLCYQKILYADRLLSQGPHNVMICVPFYKDVADFKGDNIYRNDAIARLYVLNSLNGESDNRERRYQSLKNDLLEKKRAMKHEEVRQKLENLLSSQSVAFDFKDLVKRLANELDIYI